MNTLRPIEHRHDGVVFRSQLALPDGAGPHPGIMVMHDGRGVGPFVCERATRLSSVGYAALAADMHGGGRFYESGQGAKATMALRADGPKLRARVVAAFEAFRALPEVDGSRIGALGFCFGGQCVLELARSGAEAGAVVSFHGTLGTHAPAVAGGVRTRVLALTGARDPFAPKADVEGFQAEMAAAGVDWQMTIYGNAFHGFTDPIADEMRGQMAGVGYDALVDRLSWAQGFAFLDAALRS